MLTWAVAWIFVNDSLTNTAPLMTAMLLDAVIALALARAAMALAVNRKQ